MKTTAGPAFAVDAVPFPPAADRPATPPRRGWLRYPSSAYDQRSAMLFLAPMIAVLMTVAVFPVPARWVGACPPRRGPQRQYG